MKQKGLLAVKLRGKRETPYVTKSGLAEQQQSLFDLTADLL
jgi:hypothetical protein